MIMITVVFSLFAPCLHTPCVFSFTFQTNNYYAKFVDNAHPPQNFTKSTIRSNHSNGFEVDSAARLNAQQVVPLAYYCIREKGNREGKCNSRDSPAEIPGISCLLMLECDK